MPGLIVWKNQEMNRLRRDMDRLLGRLWDDFGVPFFPGTARDLPFIDLSEKGDTLIVKAEIPGINPEDLEISISDDVLTIKGEMKREVVDGIEDYHRIERRYGSFTRNLQLPCKVKTDEVNATYRKGVLSLIMPKCKPEKGRDIKIRVK